MKKISIYKKDDSLGWQGILEVDQVEAWKAKQIALNSWGKPDRWIEASLLSQEEIEKAEDMRVSDSSGRDIREYFYSADYRIVEESIGDAPHWEQLRNDRNLRLAECDWCILSDADLTTTQKSNWKVYRQALRDLPDNTVDPRNPNWPSKP